MTKRPWWAFSVETWLDEPGAGAAFAIWMLSLTIGLSGIVIGMAGQPQSMLIAKLVVIPAAVTLAYQTLRLAYTWWRYILLRTVRPIADIALTEPATERNSFLDT